ncbi:hypothetical protein N7494_005015 [Penicillium frequentans]|uniref:Uncharacterized protein n=1 Tax=Penicillium frequentans TaxID=3151616 RepID=A0AAD6D1Q3_9EURO|nr:hypothetical protein N7494_005015 [Penicillium glabrum]
MPRSLSTHNSAPLLSVDESKPSLRSIEDANGLIALFEATDDHNRLLLLLKELLKLESLVGAPDARNLAVDLLSLNVIQLLVVLKSLASIEDILDPEVVEFLSLFRLLHLLLQVGLDLLPGGLHRLFVGLCFLLGSFQLNLELLLKSLFMALATLLKLLNGERELLNVLLQDSLRTCVLSLKLMDLGRGLSELVGSVLVGLEEVSLLLVPSKLLKLSSGKLLFLSLQLDVQVVDLLIFHDRPLSQKLVVDQVERLSPLEALLDIVTSSESSVAGMISLTPEVLVLLLLQFKSRLVILPLNVEIGVQALCLHFIIDSFITRSFGSAALTPQVRADHRKLGVLPCQLNVFFNVSLVILVQVFGLLPESFGIHSSFALTLTGLSGLLNSSSMLGSKLGSPKLKLIDLLAKSGNLLITDNQQFARDLSLGLLSIALLGQLDHSEAGLAQLAVGNLQLALELLTALLSGMKLGNSDGLVMLRDIQLLDHLGKALEQVVTLGEGDVEMVCDVLTSGDDLSPVVGVLDVDTCHGGEEFVVTDHGCVDVMDG